MGLPGARRALEELQGVLPLATAPAGDASWAARPGEPTMKVRDDFGRLEAAAKRVGDAIRDSIPPGVGFTLFLFDFGDRGGLTYLSSADRSDMLNVLREFLARRENQS
jgi:hypothetical protein